MTDFRRKVGVVTGAASGIGRGLALRFARDGMRLVLADIEKAPLETLAENLRAGGSEVETLVTDVSSGEAVEALAVRAYDAFGTVHVVCNNAGVVPAGRYRPVWEFSIEDWRWAIDVNLMGVVHGIRSFVPRMRAVGGWGHIVNTISVAGLYGGAGSPVYGASKHAALRATEALYSSLMEEGSPIGVTALCPGVVKTAIGTSERNRPASLRQARDAPDEIAAMQAASDAVTARGLDPDAVAAMVVEAIERRQFYLVTTTAFDGAIRVRMEDMLERRNPTPVDLLALATGDVNGR